MSNLFRFGANYAFVVLLKRLLNFSTRPPVSTSFCLPVKNGWQFEHISTWIFSFVEPVAITLPHAQVIVVCLYSGCIPSFISAFSSFRSRSRKCPHDTRICKPVNHPPQAALYFYGAVYKIRAPRRAFFRKRLLLFLHGKQALSAHRGTV